MNLDDDELEEKLSELVSDLFDEFDKSEKGYLSELQFVDLLNKHSNKEMTSPEIKRIMSTDSIDGKIVDKVDLFNMLRSGN